MNFGVEMRRYQDNYFSNNRMRGSIDVLSFQNFLLGQNGVQNGTGYSDLYTTSVAVGRSCSATTVYATFPALPRIPGKRCGT